MEQRNINKEQAYKKMCAQLEKAKMYDGRGTEDVYICGTCPNVIFSKYVDKGVTPFCIKCVKCGGMMQHERTLPCIIIPVDIEWYRPTFEEFEQLNESQQQHVREGGLVKRYVNKQQYTE